ncbi:MAG: hydroxymethylbilane synthase [Syntrophobacterales bacterium]|jgi:hydroxymethylbilane synthase|nr:hydroxymethylbilane synthase [Syntrophobacterales bacterium]
MKRKWIIGTRGSKLALKQTDMVMEQLKSFHPDLEFITKIIKTTGDIMLDKPLQSIGDKGFFVKEIEDDLLSGGIDLAVHSMKDLPGDLAPGLVVGAALKREDPRDAFVSFNLSRFDRVAKGSKIGTNSLRRKSQILNLNPGVVIIPIRGNIDTRISKIETLGLDGAILALAGMKRMGFESLVKDILSLDMMVPSSGQGAICVETRDEKVLIDLLRPIDDPETRKVVTIERKVQNMMGGGCSVPLGINAAVTDGVLTLRIAYGDEDGVRLARVKESGSQVEADEIVRRAVEKATAGFKDS